MSAPCPLLRAASPSPTSTPGHTHHSALPRLPVGTPAPLTLPPSLLGKFPAHRQAFPDASPTGLQWSPSPATTPHAHPTVTPTSPAEVPRRPHAPRSEKHRLTPACRAHCDLQVDVGVTQAPVGPPHPHSWTLRRWLQSSSQPPHLLPAHLAQRSSPLATSGRDQRDAEFLCSPQHPWALPSHKPPWRGPLGTKGEILQTQTSWLVPGTGEGETVSISPSRILSPSHSIPFLGNHYPSHCLWEASGGLYLGSCRKARGSGHAVRPYTSISTSLVLGFTWP